MKRYNWSDDPKLQIAFKNELKERKEAPKLIKLEKKILMQEETIKKLRTRNKGLSNIAKREGDRWRQKKKGRIIAQQKEFEKQCNGLGFCLFCGCMDLDVLQEHHIFGRNYDEMTTTLCPNCHHRLHRFLGVMLGSNNR